MMNRTPDSRYTHVLVHDSAYRSLVAFSATTIQIRDALIRLALAHGTISGLATFQALLAFSSLQRDGLNRQAMQLKIMALQSLSTSARESTLSLPEAAQHVAASMLLGAFEVGYRQRTKMTSIVTLSPYM